MKSIIVVVEYIKKKQYPKFQFKYFNMSYIDSNQHFIRNSFVTLVFVPLIFVTLVIVPLIFATFCSMWYSCGSIIIDTNYYTIYKQGWCRFVCLHHINIAVQQGDTILQQSLLFSIHLSVYKQLPSRLY